MRAARPALLLLGCWWLAVIGAQEVEPERPEAVPDLDFLEYLGAWVEDDDEWLAIEEWRKDDAVDSEKDAEKSESERDDDDERE
jgi:hypothetical protein